jgi:hypothetical protein
MILFVQKKDNGKGEIIPQVNTPCTEIYYSDRRPATVVNVYSQSRIGVRDNRVIIKSETEEIITEELEGDEHIYTRRKYKDGSIGWILEGTTSRDWGIMLALGFRHYYYDRSF